MFTGGRTEKVAIWGIFGAFGVTEGSMFTWIEVSNCCECAQS